MLALWFEVEGGCFLREVGCACVGGGAHAAGGASVAVGGGGLVRADVGEFGEGGEGGAEGLGVFAGSLYCFADGLLAGLAVGG